MDRLTQVDRIVALVAAPPILAVIVWLGMLATAGVSGRHPVWTFEPRSVAEAAAFGDPVAVVQRIQGGDDPNRAGDVRAGAARTETTRLTPIEAAAAAGEPAMVRLLLDLGAAPDAAVWQRAWCLSDEPGVRDALESRRPPGAAEDCGAP